MRSPAPARPAAVVRTLLVTQFAFNVGFYAVVPFIAVRLHDDLAASGTAIAVTLAVRTFSQQGMFVVGGALADRFGSRRVMVAGTAVRASGYLALAHAGSVPLMIGAACLTGIGGALFSPALESLLAGRASSAVRAGRSPAARGRRRRPGARSRDRLFALLAVYGEVGAVLGPVVGGLLLVQGFAVTATAGALLFALVGAALFFVLPAEDRGRGRDYPTSAHRAPTTPAHRAPTTPTHPTGPSWRAALRHRRFVLFCIAYSSYLLSYNQLYVALPVELDRVGADDHALVGLYMLAAVLVIAGQLPVAALTRRLPTRSALTLGFGLMSSGFVVVACAAPSTAGSWTLAPAISWVALLSLGQMTVVPVAMAEVARFAGSRALGAFYGLLATAGGVAVLLGSVVIGPLLDQGRRPGPAAAAPWWLMAAFPALSAVALFILLRPGAPARTPRLLEPDRRPTSPLPLAPTLCRNGPPMIDTARRPTRNPRRAPRTALAVAAVAAFLLLAGCFAGPGTATPTSSTTSTAAGGATATSDGRVRLAMLQPPRSGLTPFSDDAFKLSRWSTAETLVVLDANGDAQPALATEWTRVDDLTWSFTLRTGVTFHDGAPFDAAAVVTALTAATTASPKPRILDGVELTVTSDAAGAVTVRTAVPDPLIPQRLSSPQLSILSPDAYAGGPVSPIGNGTGPFELVAVGGTTTATLDRYDGYWGQAASASGIDVDFVPDGTARAAALRTGTADVVEAIPVSQAAVIDPTLIHEVPMPRTNTLYLNTETGVFTDPAVRAAARAALDTSVIVERVYEGRADRADGLLGPALPWAADRPDRSPRPAATDVATVQPKITLGTFTDRAELPEVAIQLEQQLEAAGFQVEQVVREYSYIEADALAGAFDAFILSRATVLDSGDPVAYMYSDFACAGSFNISQLCDPQIDRALEAAAGTPAGPARRDAILQVEKLILESDAAIPMLHERVIQGELAGVTDAARDPRERTLVTAATRTG